MIRHIDDEYTLISMDSSKKNINTRQSNGNYFLDHAGHLKRVVFKTYHPARFHTFKKRYSSPSVQISISNYHYPFVKRNQDAWGNG